MRIWLMLLLIAAWSCQSGESARADENTMTNLLTAIYEQDSPRVDSLLSLGVDPDLRDADGTPLLHLLYHQLPGNHTDQLIALGADINARREQYFGTSLLMEAAALGDTHTVRQLLQAGADVNISDFQQETALHWAAIRGQEAVARLLLQAGADPRHTGSYGTAAQVALRHRHDELARLLWPPQQLQAVTRSASAAFAAIANGQTERLRALLQEGLPADAKNEIGTPLLVAAATDGREEMAALLINQGASPNAVNAVQHTALARAAARSQLALIHQLLAAGAAVDGSGTIDVHTPLHSAAQTGQAAAIQLLLQAGASADPSDEVQQYTPLMYAIQEGHVAAAKALLAGGASPFVRTREGASMVDLLGLSPASDTLGIILSRYMD